MAITKEAASEHIALRIAKHIWKNYSLILILIGIFIVAGILQPRFLTVSNQLIIFRHAAIIGMMALGMTFVVIAGGIDLSAGHASAAAGTVMILLMGNGVPIPIAIFACFATAMLIGLANGLIITKFKLPAFIVTLAIGLIVRSIALNLAGGVSITAPRVPAFTNIGNGTLIGAIPNALLIWVVSAVILGCILAYTKFGSYVYAVGGNETAARYSGINVDRIRIICYVIIGFCVGMSTLLNFSRMAAIATTSAAQLYEFDAITAVVVGGTTLAGGRGKILGAFFGMIAVSVVGNLTIMFGISPYLTGLIKGSIILVAILLQRRG